MVFADVISIMNPTLRLDCPVVIILFFCFVFPLNDVPVLLYSMQSKQLRVDFKHNACVTCLLLMLLLFGSVLRVPL